ncbi:hypothetical protein ACOMHN_033007 [Nucella lapillus]
MVYCIKRCQKIQQRKNRNFSFIKGKQEITNYFEEGSLVVNTCQTGAMAD